EEIEDWNCCGATLSVGLDDRGSTYLCARNIAIAEKMGLDLAVPCSACFTALKKAEYTMEDSPGIKEKVRGFLKDEGFEYEGKPRVRHVIDILVNDAEEEIKKSVKKSLKGIKAAPYYGCQIVRPKSELDDTDHPVILDKLVSYIGAEPSRFTMKSKCCSGLLVQTMENVADDMIREILLSAKQGGADMIVTACPLCQLNLEAYQSKLSRKYKEDLNIPILYFTQLMGVAFGIDPKKLGIDRNFINADKALAKATGGK
ncbi:MAG TPA: disulfide reductase, partial [bacterium]|nr:disulfide reductase [bacterium]